MRDDERYEDEDDDSPPLGRGFELFYYERRGSRYYLRMTRVALLLVVGLTLISIAGLLILFFVQRSDGVTDVNVNISTPPSDVHYPPVTIQQPSLPPNPRRAIRQPKAAQPPSPTLPSPVRNGNEQ
jgi:hypothetical protein